MKGTMWRGTTMLVALTLLSEASVYEFKDKYIEPYIVEVEVPVELEKYSASAAVSDEEYIRHIHSMFDSSPNDSGERTVIETNALIDTKYRTLKRNADIINSLLALPKGMNDAGR